MENHFEICMTEDQLRGISSIGLAHMGDAVFELLVRGWLCQHGKATGKVAVLAEGDAADRTDIKFLKKLPLFNADGTVKD